MHKILIDQETQCQTIKILRITASATTNKLSNLKCHYTTLTYAAINNKLCLVRFSMKQWHHACA